MVTERVEIIITSKGTRVVTRDLASIGTASKKSAGSVQFLNRAVAALGSAIVLRKLVRVADTYNLLQNRLRVVTDTSKELEEVQNRLFDIANESRSAVEGVTNIYSRFALALKDTNIEQRQLLNLTENVTKAAIIGGAAQAEARAGLIQLSQALASNRLSGDELRSVLEQLPAVAQRIAKSLGVGVGELRKLGEAGILTRDVLIEAFGEVDEELQAQFAKTVPTISQSLTVLNNKLIQSVGEFDKATGSSAKFAKMLILLSDNLNIVALGILTIGVAIATIKVATLVAPLFTKLGAIAALKFTGVVAGLIGIFFAAVKLRDISKTLSQNIDELRISFDELISERGRENLKQFRDDQQTLVAAIGNADNNVKAFGRTMQAQANIIESANQRAKRRLDLMGSEAGLQKQLNDIKDQGSAADIAAAEAGIKRLTGLQQAQKVLAAQAKILKDQQGRQDAANIQLQALEGLYKDAAISAEVYSSELAKLTKKGVDPLLVAQQQLNLAQTTGIQIQKQAAEQLLAIKGPQIAFKNNLAAIDLLLKQGTISTEEATVARKKLFEQEEKAAGKRGGKGAKDGPFANFLKDINDFATQSEQVLVNAFQSAENALVDFVLTGKFNFSGLVDSVLADLTRLLARQALAALIGALGSASGGGGGAAGGLLAGLIGGARAGGGSVQSGRSYLVGERGPEIVNMAGNGSVTPNNEVGGASVTVINVTDQNEITDAMGSTEGEQVILNVLGRNKEAVKRAIS